MATNLKDVIAKIEDKLTRSKNDLKEQMELEKYKMTYANQLSQMQAGVASVWNSSQNAYNNIESYPNYANNTYISTTTTAYPAQTQATVFTHPMQVTNFSLDFIVDMIFIAVQKTMEEDFRRIIKEELEKAK